MVDFTLTLPHRPGELAALSARFRQADINLRGLWGAGSAEGGDHSLHADHATFYCVPESPDQFRNFAESTELNVREGQVYFVSGPAGSSALVEALERIAQAGVNLIAVQGIQHAGEFGCFIWTHPRDWSRLEEALGQS